MNQQQEFEKLHAELKPYLKRMPGYAEIILVILTMSMRERIEALTIMLEWLKKYPDMKFAGMKVTDRDYQVTQIDSNEVPFKKRYKLITRQYCHDCEREIDLEATLFCRGENHSYDLTNKHSQEQSHVVCQNCMPQEPDYEPPEPSNEFDERVDDLVRQGHSRHEAVEIAEQEFNT